jgi:3-isopropylmalate/(R)-2-methylmalate dehydratase large subunit
VSGRTLFEKIWDDHVVTGDDPALLYVDLHLIHEVTSPQAFAGLDLAGRKVRRPDLTVATVDHAIPTTARSLGIRDPQSKKQVDTLKTNTEKHDITFFGLDDPRQGIVHVVGPENGYTQPGKVIVCGDSHTSTHGPSERWRSGSAPPRSSTCWRPRPFGRDVPRRWQWSSTGHFPPASRPRT